MAVSYEDVCRSAVALLGRGSRPTVDSVRIELGDTGSNSTISRFLDRFWSEALPLMLSNRFKRDDWPEAMNNLVNDMLDQVMGLASASAEASFVQARQAAESQALAAERVRAEAEQRAQAAIEALAGTAHDLDIARAKIADLQNQLAARDVLLEAKNALLAEQDGRLIELEQARQDAVANAETQIRTERERQEVIYKGLQETLMLNIDRERTTWQERLEDYRRRLEHANADKQMAEQRLISVSNSASTRQRELEDKLLVLEEKYNDRVDRLTQAQTKLDAAEKSNQQLTGQLVLWKRRARVIERE